MLRVDKTFLQDPCYLFGGLEPTELFFVFGIINKLYLKRKQVFFFFFFFFVIKALKF